MRDGGRSRSATKARALTRSAARAADPPSRRVEPVSTRRASPLPPARAPRRAVLTGSVGSISKSRLRTMWPSVHAADEADGYPRPSTQPASRRTSHRILSAVAPMAIRIPSSRVRCGDAVGQHAVQPDRGKRQRQAAEERRDRRHQPFAQQRTPDLLFDGTDVGHRHLAIDRGHRLSERGRQRHRIAGRSQMHGHARAPRPGALRDVDHANRPFSQAGVLAVLDDADDLEVIGSLRQADAAADRVLVAEVVPGKRLVHDQDVRAPRQSRSSKSRPRSSGIIIVLK